MVSIYQANPFLRDSLSHFPLFRKKKTSFRFLLLFSYWPSFPHLHKKRVVNFLAINVNKKKQVKYFWIAAFFWD